MPEEHLNVLKWIREVSKHANFQLWTSKYRGTDFDDMSELYHKTIVLAPDSPVKRKGKVSKETVLKEIVLQEKKKQDVDMVGLSEEDRNILSTLISSQRVNLWNTVTKTKLCGRYAPYKKGIMKFLARNPEYVIFKESLLPLAEQGKRGSEGGTGKVRAIPKEESNSAPGDESKVESKIGGVEGAFDSATIEVISSLMVVSSREVPSLIFLL